MKKQVLLTLASLMILSSVAMAQTSARKEPFKPQLSIGVGVGIEGYVRLTPAKMGCGFGETETADYSSSNNSVAFPPFISFEARLSKHSGLETGIGCRYLPKTITIPILYKFTSRILNFSTGVTLDFNLNSNLPSDASILLPGVMVKISKDINLSKKFILEPFLHANPLSDIKAQAVYMAWGGGLKLRYKF